MKQLRKNNFWLIGLLVFSSLTGCIRDAYYHFSQGVANYEAGDLEQAIKDYTKAIELDSTYTLAYNYRGSVYYDLGNIEQAITDYNKEGP